MCREERAGGGAAFQWLRTGQRKSPARGGTDAATVARQPKAFLGESPTLGRLVLDWSLKHIVRFSVVASLGTMLDVSWANLIDYFGAIPVHTSSCKSAPSLQPVVA